MSFFFVKPITITDAMLISSNVPETDYSAFNIATTYAVGDEVQVTTVGVHKVFRSLEAGNVGNQPEDNYLTSAADYDAENNPVPWLQVRSTNTWGMFDGRSRAETSYPDSIDVSVIPGEIYNTIAIINAEADYIHVTITDSTDGLVFGRTYEMLDLSDVTGWWEFLFTEPRFKSAVIIEDLPAYPNATIRIIAENTDETAAIGEFVVGMKTEIGTVPYGYTFGIADYSKKDRDQDTGIAILEEGIFSSTYTQDIYVSPDRAYWVKRKLSEIRATPSVFCGSTANEETIVYGWYKDFSVNAATKKQYICSIEIEELS